MAVIKCPECGGKVAQTLSACSHCGFRLSLDPASQAVPPPPPPAADIGADIVTCFNQHFSPSDRLFFEPKIPRRVREGASRYLRLQSDEKLIAIFDETLMGSAKDGFAFTTKRVYWKNGTGSNDVQEYRNLTGPFSLGGIFNPVLRLGSDLEIEIHMTEAETRPALVSFLGKARSVYTEGLQTSARSSSAADAEAYTLSCFGQISPSDRIHVAPHIPERVRIGANRYLELESDERLLAIYDDTLLGSGKNGFSLTTRRVLWKNTGQRSQVRNYASLSGPFDLVDKAKRLQLGPDLTIDRAG